MHIPIRSLPIRTDYDLTTVYGSTLNYFAKSVVGEKKKSMPGKSINQRKTLQYRAYQNREKFMIRVLLICHGRALCTLISGDKVR